MQSHKQSAVKRRKHVCQDTHEGDSKSPTFQQKLSHYIGQYSEAPQYVADNHNIISGYRINFDSTKKVLKSMFMLHNETINVWTHVIGFVIVIILCLVVANSYQPFDDQAVHGKIASRLTQNFESLCAEVRSFDDALNSHITEGQRKLEGGVADLNKGVRVGLESFVSELEALQQANATMFYDRLRELSARVKEFLEEELTNLSSTAATQMQRLKAQWDERSNNLLFNYTTVRERVLGTIDSQQFDWIDLLHYIDNEQSAHDFAAVAAAHHISRWPILVFLVTAALCLFFSATFHLVYVISPKVNRVFLRLDYAGVCLLISGSTFPLYYYGFYCQTVLATVYLTVIGLSCLVVFVVSLQDFIHTPQYLTCKSWMYALLGIGAGAPMIHLSYLEYTRTAIMDQPAGAFQSVFPLYDGYSSSPSLSYYALMGVSYLGGLYIYTKRCPEKYKPGHFDICGASHQIWHVSIIIAIVLTYVGALINFYTRVENACPLV